MKPCVFLLALAAASSSIAAPWTYQGNLNDGGKPANGRYDLRLTLLNETNNLGVSSPLTLHGVEVRDGQFSVEVDFGLDLAAAPVLSILTEVQQNNSGFVALGAPKRFDAKAALAGVCWDTEGNSGTNPDTDFLGTVDAQPLVFRTRNAQSLRIEPSVQLFNGAPITTNIIAGSTANFVQAGVRGAKIGGGGAPLGDSDPVFLNEAPNVVTDSYGTVSGGMGNVAGNGDANPVGQGFAVVAGGVGNRAGAQSSVVSGGSRNIATGLSSAIGGGLENVASSTYSVVGGGFKNAAGNANAVVAGGANNSATGVSAFVGGGASNSATADSSTVAGGIFNCAGAFSSWAGGRNAKVRPGTNSGNPGAGCAGVATNGTQGDIGTFVWADAQNEDFVSSGGQRFLVRAFDGALITGSSAINSPEGNRLRVNGTLRVDTLGSAGSTSLCRNASNQIASCSSSARYKQDISDLDLGLAAVSALHPVSYRWKDSGAADVGFVAEEVAALDERLIVRNDSGEVEGVRYDRLSAVLAGAVQELAARESLAQQERDVLAARLAHLEQRLSQLEK